MTDINQKVAWHWSRERAALLFVVCLVCGFAGGWVIRGFQPASTATAAQINAPSSPATQPASPAQVPGPDQMKITADAQAAPLVAQLKSAPNNPELLISIGNLYYDARQYPVAVDYYSRALAERPSDASARTDMATAYWYLGDTDRALAEFDKALTYAPNNPNTLFNRGLVKWHGKKDAAGATADWKRLLAISPNYEQKDMVEQLLTEVKSHTANKSGI
jgi:tetratricopeptide (TPR) repeat protein